MTKRLIAFLTAFVICGAALCGCAEKENKGDNSSTGADSSTSQSETNTAAGAGTGEASQTAETSEPGLTIDGKKMETDGLVMLTIDGRDIDFDTFRYYYFGTVNQLAQKYGATLDTIRNTENGFQVLLDNVIMNIKQDHVTYRLAEENNITLTDEDKAAAQESYNNVLKQAGSEDEFKKVLEQSHLTETVAKNMFEHAKLFEKTSDLFVEGGKYATTKDEFREIVKDSDVYSCVRSILIPYECKAEITDETDKQSYDSYTLSEKMNAKKRAYNALDDEKKEEVKKQSEALAREVLEKAHNGEDFEALLAEYGWDPGMETNPQGYYMTHNTSFVPEFLEAGFALKEGEVVSDLVVSSAYGWFIIKRNPVDMDYVEQNIDKMIQEYDLPRIQKVYTDIMDDMKVTYSDVYNQMTIDSIT